MTGAAPTSRIASEAARTARTSQTSQTTRTVEVIRAGALTTIQDLGRPGYAHLGVGRSGALDPATHSLLNRLVGNPPTAATLETTLTGITLRPTSGRGVVAAVGGAAADVRIDGRPAAWGAAVRVPGGAQLDVGPARFGLRSYVALAGGVDAEMVLGSRSTDLFSGLGPAALRDGDVLALGEPAGPADGADPLPWSVAGWADPVGAVDLPILPGPRADRISRAAWHQLYELEYTVGSASNRIALRLSGPSLERDGPDTVPSEGAVLGAVQVPADGRPILFLADHPTVGGYPVIGVVTSAGLAAAAQAAPGRAVRFRPVGRG
jgi:biotin-dependent carboxylase-like uncharacterized protein